MKENKTDSAETTLEELSALQSLFDSEIKGTLTKIGSFLDKTSSLNSSNSTSKDFLPAEYQSSKEEKQEVKNFQDIYELIKIGTELKNEIESIDENIELHPALADSRERGLQLMEQLKQKADTLKQGFLANVHKPVDPYRDLLEEYLGKDFIVPSIHDLAFPDLNTFKITDVPKKLADMASSINDTIAMRTKELSALSTSSSELPLSAIEINHAFSVLSATSEGMKYVVDREKTARYLLFAETVKAISPQYIQENPFIVSYKLLYEWCNIFNLA